MLCIRVYIFLIICTSCILYTCALTGQPEITEPPRNETVVDGKTFIMKCSVYGTPKPEVKWLKNGIELTGDRYHILENGDLKINDVQFLDAGDYRCYATNKLGTVDASGSLVVKEHTSITDTPYDYEVPAGIEATFRCNAITDPSLELKIIWLYKDLPIHFDSEPRFVHSRDNSLTISNTNELDSGVYTCVARTKYDEATAQATLTVLDVPKAPVLLSMECHKNMATLKWHSSENDRNPILYFTIQHNTSFTPETWKPSVKTVPSTESSYNVSISPWTKYTFRVIAWNKIGPSNPSSYSDVCSAPPEIPYKNPDNVEGRGTEPNNLVIYWTPMREVEHNAPGFKYRVQWRRNIPDEKWNSEDVLDWTQKELVVRDQPTFKEYVIKVAAINELGESKVAPNEVIGYSGEAEPLEAPMNFTLTDVISATTAMFEWNPVHAESIRGHFKGYKIQIWTDRDGEDGLKETHINKDATRALVSKFVPHSKNYARILVYNGRYNGPPSNILSFATPEGVPGIVEQFDAYPMGSSAFYLVWKKPKQPNGDLTGYIIYYHTVRKTSMEPPRELEPRIHDPSRTQVKLTGLESNTIYRITIRATTKEGEGEEYFIEKRTGGGDATKPDTPDFKWYRMPTENGLANVKVVWLPNLRGKPGSMFYVKYKAKNQTFEQETSPELNEDFIEVRGLLPGEVYTFTVVSVDGDQFTESQSQEVDT